VRTYIYACKILSGVRTSNEGGSDDREKHIDNMQQTTFSKIVYEIPRFFMKTWWVGCGGLFI
jgi:hypothetical protein